MQRSEWTRTVLRIGNVCFGDTVRKWKNVKHGEANLQRCRMNECCLSCSVSTCNNEVHSVGNELSVTCYLRWTFQTWNIQVLSASPILHTCETDSAKKGKDLLSVSLRADMRTKESGYRWTKLNTPWFCPPARVNCSSLALIRWGRCCESVTVSVIIFL